MLLFSHSVVSNSLWPHGPQHIRLPCPSLFPRACSNSSFESVMPSNHLILCCPLLLLPSIFPSIRLFSSESALRIRWPKYWRFSFSISLSNEYSGLISFRIDPKPSQTQSCRPGLGLRGFKMAVGPSLALCRPSWWRAEVLRVQQQEALGSQDCMLKDLPALAARLGGAARMCRFYKACRPSGRDTPDSWPTKSPDVNCQSTQ